MTAAYTILTPEGVRISVPVDPDHPLPVVGNFDTAALATSALQAAGNATSASILAEMQGGTPQAVKGSIASGSTASDPPVTQGGRAADANPTAVANAQVVATMHDPLGKMVVVGAPRSLRKSQRTLLTASVAETTIVTAVASEFHDLYGCLVANSSGSDAVVDIRDDTGGTIITTIAVKAGTTGGFMVPAGNGFAQTAVNKNWTAQSRNSVASLEITALYVKTTA